MRKTEGSDEHVTVMRRRLQFPECWSDLSGERSPFDSTLHDGGIDAVVVREELFNDDVAIILGASDVWGKWRGPCPVIAVALPSTPS